MEKSNIPADANALPEESLEYHPEIATADTMIYREPVADSDQSQVHEIWGKKLETKVVDFNNTMVFQQHLDDGWTQDPVSLVGTVTAGGGSGAANSNVDASTDVANAASALADELDAKVATLEVELEARSKALAEAEAQRDEALADLATEKELRAATSAQLAKVEAELKALKAKPKN